MVFEINEKKIFFRKKGLPAKPEYPENLFAYVMSRNLTNKYLKYAEGINMQFKGCKSSSI